MYSKFKARESEMCPCNADIMTAEHLLQHCQLRDVLRPDTWQKTDTTEGQASMELRRTAAFMRGNRHLCLAYDDDDDEEEAL